VALIDEFRQGRQSASSRLHTFMTPTRSLTYEELSGEVRRAAAGLRTLGVRPDERVLFCMADDIELFTGILAAFRIGVLRSLVQSDGTEGEL
jgi:acyl-coenzyme A synthetase/AMP-(fatty) acid ligase